MDSRDRELNWNLVRESYCWNVMLLKTRNTWLRFARKRNVDKPGCNCTPPRHHQESIFCFLVKSKCSPLMSRRFVYPILCWSVVGVFTHCYVDEWSVCLPIAMLQGFTCFAVAGLLLLVHYECLDRNRRRRGPQIQSCAPRRGWGWQDCSSITVYDLGVHEHLWRISG
jgi:hypothetical protein